jgi:hypothetical protein
VALLRASGKHTGADYDLSAVLGQAGDESGIPHAGVLTAFAEAAIGDDPDRLAEARRAVIDAMGEAALADAAGVAALFNAIDRVADATGIPLEPEKAEMTADFRAALGIDGFGQVPADGGGAA